MPRGASGDHASTRHTGDVFGHGDSPAFPYRAVTGSFAAVQRAPIAAPSQLTVYVDDFAAAAQAMNLIPADLGRVEPEYVAARTLDIRTMSSYIHYVTERRPALLPLLRSENQLRLLAALLLAPERTWTITELARATGVPQPSASREVARLGEAGVLRVRGSRSSRQVSADVDSVIFPELQGLLLKTVGPKPVLETCLSEVVGIESAFIYGSWARRYEGEAGAPPGDIDLLVVGTPQVDAVHDAAESAAARLGREVNPTVLTRHEWEASSEGFIEQVRRSPLVGLDLSHSHLLETT